MAHAGNFHNVPFNGPSSNAPHGRFGQPRQGPGKSLGTFEPKAAGPESGGQGAVRGAGSAKPPNPNHKNFGASQAGKAVKSRHDPVALRSQAKAAFQRARKSQRSQGGSETAKFNTGQVISEGF